jgi:hypothetical protein
MVTRVCFFLVFRVVDTSKPRGCECVLEVKLFQWKQMSLFLFGRKISNLVWWFPPVKWGSYFINFKRCLDVIYKYNFILVSPPKFFFPYLFLSLLVIFSFLSFCDTGDWFQGLVHARQAFYHWAISLIFCVCLFETRFCYASQAGSQAHKNCAHCRW